MEKPNEITACTSELTNVCACVDEMPACDYCQEKNRRIYEAEFDSAKSAGTRASWLGYCEPEDEFLGEKEDDDSGRWHMVYTFKSAETGKCFYVKVDQDGGEECGDGEWS